VPVEFKRVREQNLLRETLENGNPS